MATTKARTVKVRIAVAFDDKGHADTYGEWCSGKRPTDEALLREVKRWCELPYSCIVEVELTPPKGKVVKVKAVKP